MESNNMVTHYEYTAIMNQVEYDPESKEWRLLGKYLKDHIEDYVLRFSSRYEAHQYVYNHLEKIG